MIVERDRDAAFQFDSAETEPDLPEESLGRLGLRWVVRLRYGMIAGEVLLIAGAFWGLKLKTPVAVIGPMLALQVLTNWRLGRREAPHATTEHVVGALFTLDALCLTAILAFTGGPENPFSLLYLVQITFSALALRRSWTWALGILSTLSFGMLFWVSRDIPALHTHEQPDTVSLHLLGMWFAFAAAALLISFFVGHLSAEARRKGREIFLMQKRLARNERLASLVTLAAGAAHEIATPLATIAVTAKEMERAASERLDDKRALEDAVLIRSQVERCRVILERMGAQGADPLGEAPKATGCAELLALVQSRFPEDSHRVRIQVGGSVTRCVVPVRAAVEALAALLKNALDASPGGEPVVLEAKVAGPYMRFMICDQGAGMTPEVIERVSEPFFTTKAPGKGMGLGAFLAHLFARRLGGQLSFESQPGKGCTAIMDLPAANHVQR